MDLENNADNLQDDMVEAQDTGYSEDQAEETSTEANEDTYDESETEELDSSEEPEDGRTEKKTPGNVPYNRFQEANNKAKTLELTLEAERKYYQSLLQTPKVPEYKTPEQLAKEQEVAEAKRRLKEEYGVLTQEDLAEVKKSWEEEQTEKEQKREFERSINEQAKELETQYANVPGVPKKVNVQELIDFGSEKGIYTQDLDTLFKIKYFNQLVGGYNTPKSKPTPVAPQAATTASEKLDPLTADLDVLAKTLGRYNPDTKQVEH